MWSYAPAPPIYFTWRGLVLNYLSEKCVPCTVRDQMSRFQIDVMRKGTEGL